MSVDAQGFIWISHPAVAAAVIIGVTGLLLWCHRTLDADTTPEPVAVPVPVDDTVAPPVQRTDANHRPAA